MHERDHGRRRPVVLDVDEWEYLPKEVFIPLQQGMNTDSKVRVELQEMTDSRMALLVYSSMERLIAALGDAQFAMKRPAADLPRLRRQLRFQAVLLDIRLPATSRAPTARAAFEPLPLAIDKSTGEPMVFVPARSFRPDTGTAQVELQRLADGRVAMLTYSSQSALLDGCGPNQRFVAFPSDRIEEFRQLSGADTVLIDAPLPSRLRHSR